MPTDYGQVLSEIKQRISKRRARAVVAANTELVLLYWEIGGLIRKRLQAGAWGTGVVARLAKDLRESHPQMKGFSSRNLRHMARFAEEFDDPEIVKQAVSQLPWGHVIRLMQRVKEPQVRLWYAQAAIADGWSRATLELQIDAQAHRRQGQALTNFETALPPEDSFLAKAELQGPLPLRLRRSPGRPQGRRSNLRRGPALPPPQAPVLRGDRAQSRGFRA